MAVTAVTLLAAPGARAVILDAGAYDPDPTPPKPVVTCTLGDAGIKVTSFADILGYQLAGSCVVSFPGTKRPPVTSAYEGGGSWNSATGQVNEWIKGKDPKGQPWEIQDGGTCTLDPWMTGKAAAGCSATQGSATPNAPANFVKKLGYPVSPDLLDASARGILTGRTLAAIKAEHQAPVIVKPAEGSHPAFPLTLGISAGAGSPTKTFALEWEANVNGAWTKKNVLDQAGSAASIAPDKFGGLGAWRVRARAHQTTKAAWSAWRAFTVPTLGPPAMATPCPNASAWGAAYDATAMSSTIAVGAKNTALITITNGSNQVWGAGTNFHLSYHWVQNGLAVVFDGERTAMPTAVLPCMKVQLAAAVKGPPSAGAWTIQWDMVLEGVSWFSAKGVPTGNKDVTATDAPAPPAPAKK
jgi:hypothetical protein